MGNLLACLLFKTVSRPDGIGRKDENQMKDTRPDRKEAREWEKERKSTKDITGPQVHFHQPIITDSTVVGNQEHQKEEKRTKIKITDEDEDKTETIDDNKDKIETTGKIETGDDYEDEVEEVLDRINLAKHIRSLPVISASVSTALYEAVIKHLSGQDSYMHADETPLSRAVARTFNELRYNVPDLAPQRTSEDEHCLSFLNPYITDFSEEK
ncbi:17276_t:CDS:2 [Acaulospora morrowiae]|uniref:17276_t:CDS:1 n=1 Tax=Acaulospora morrowiae TaxID=94023 RepID=A0A9N9CJH9_9GLOM|nr:17276_t:CDS:2 [Acaulospora morrowiae]